MTVTLQEGRELVIALARRSVGAVQPDADTAKVLRPGHATDADLLTLAADVVAVESRDHRCRRQLLARNICLGNEAEPAGSCAVGAVR